MKRLYLLLTLACILVHGTVMPARLRAFLSYSTFYSPDHGSYLESYLTVLGKSVVFVKKDNGKFQGTVLVTMLFKQNDSIRDFRKYELSSPEVEDTAHIDFSFLDQQRIPLPDGKYDLDLAISDKNSDHKPFRTIEPIELNYPSDRIVISGIELVESYKKSEAMTTLSKNGFDFMPYIDNFYPPSVKNMYYYAEIYNAGKRLPADENFVSVVSIHSYETGKLIAEYQKAKRETPKPVNVIFGEFDISQLPSGNYLLQISVRDKNNQELSKNEIFIQRSNPDVRYNLDQLSAMDISNSFALHFTSADTLREFVRYLFPIASASEKLFIQTYQKTATLEVLQRFFYAFWKERDPMNPVEAWNRYFEKVVAVNDEFGCAIRKGFETDRGRVYLQYGPPNQRVVEEKDPQMYPYEIWQYYKAGNQTDRRFVFCTHDIAMNCYELLHSDVLGEVYNPWWQKLAKRYDNVGRDPDNDYLRKPSMDEDGYNGGHSSRDYDIPF